MLENLESLFIIVVIAIPIFWIARAAFENLLSGARFKIYRNLWFVITLIVFLAHNFWLYVVLSVIAIQIFQHREHNKVALYLVLLFVMPPVWEKIGGGIGEALAMLNSLRLLALAVLLPAFLAIIRQRDRLPFGKTTPDKLLMAYILMIVISKLGDTTVTNVLRNGLYLAVDVVLPYYVISRSLRDIKQFKEALAAFVIAALLLSGAAIYEYATHSLLYASLGRDLGANIEMSNMLLRGGSLRALVTTGQPIALGFVVMVGLGFYLFLQRDISQFYRRNLLLLLLAGGSFVALSRGPWIGILVLLILFIGLGPRAIRNMFLLTAGSVLAFALAINLPGGDKLIDLLPFVGKTDSANVEYREQLLNHALSVIGKNPMFGSVDYRNSPEMLSMVQGEGIIDVVNSYLGIALEYGLFGLSLFASFFLSVLWGIYNTLRKYRSRPVEHHLLGVRLFKAQPDSRQDEDYLLGVTLFAVLTAILIAIYTVSSITVIPAVYWAVAGMGVAYIQMPSRNQT